MKIEKKSIIIYREDLIQTSGGVVGDGGGGGFIATRRFVNYY